MSDETATALASLRERERMLEMDAVSVKARVEEVRELIQMLEHGPRRRPGRPRKPDLTEVPTVEETAA